MGFDGKLTPTGNLGIKVSFSGPWYRRLYRATEQRLKWGIAVLKGK